MGSRVAGKQADRRWWYQDRDIDQDRSKQKANGRERTSLRTWKADFLAGRTSASAEVSRMRGTGMVAG